MNGENPLPSLLILIINKKIFFSNYAKWLRNLGLKSPCIWTLLSWPVIYIIIIIHLSFEGFPMAV